MPPTEERIQGTIWLTDPLHFKLDHPPEVLSVGDGETMAKRFAETPGQI
jgi:hypothetical protein